MWIIVLLIILALMVLGFYLLFYYMMENYITDANHNDLKDIGVSQKSFIGLHIKGTPLDDLQAKLLFVRKTSYKGLIVFAPDKNFSFYFYLPFLVAICRQGYLILSYQSQQSTMNKMPEEFKQILTYIQDDATLASYPLTLMGHGSGAYTVTQALQYTDIQTKAIALSIPENEYDAFIHYVEKRLGFSNELLRTLLLKLFKKYYPLPKAFEKPLVHSCLLISGRNHSGYLSVDENNFMHLDIHLPKNKGHHLYLSANSEAYLEKMIHYLADPQTSQFDYDKALREFDINILTQLDTEIMQLISTFLEQ